MFHVGIHPQDLYCVGPASDYADNPLTAARQFYSRLLEEDPDHSPVELILVKALTPYPSDDTVPTDIEDADVQEVWQFRCATGWEDQPPLVRLIPTSTIFQDLNQ